MRALITATIELADNDVSVASEAADGDEAVARWREERPSVVVLDQMMPGRTGLETARQILDEDPTQAVVLFSSYLDERLRQAAERLGLRACVSKRDLRRLPDVLRRLRAELD